MKYTSTRGGHSGTSFETVLFSGYAPDGGIYLPESIPKVSQNLLFQWKNSRPTYQDVVFEVVKLFVSEEELPRDILRKCVEVAYANFGVGLRNCVGVQNGGAYTVVEMFHGNTKSFKDYPLSLVGKLMEYFVKKRNNHKIILVGTSGDTGSAAIEAVKGLEGLDIIVLYPKGKVSEIQELQMITVGENNVRVYHTEGSADDQDIPIKKCFTSGENGKDLVSLNSVNWARILIQIAHHIWLHTLQSGEGERVIDIFIATGGAGNLVSGMIAREMGFKLNLYCSQNINDNVVRLVNEGWLSFGGNVEETFSNAMDCRNSYNVERMLCLVSDGETVSRLIRSAEGSEGLKPIKIEKGVHEKLMNEVKGAMRVDTETTLKVIGDCWNVNKYLICPHTATAVAFKLSKCEERISWNKAYVIATASPEKFPEAVNKAGVKLDVGNQIESKFLADLRTRQKKEPKLMRKGQDWYAILQEEISQIRESNQIAK